MTKTEILTKLKSLMNDSGSMGTSIEALDDGMLAKANAAVLRFNAGGKVKLTSKVLAGYVEKIEAAIAKLTAKPEPKEEPKVVEVKVVQTQAKEPTLKSLRQDVATRTTAKECKTKFNGRTSSKLTREECVAWIAELTKDVPEADEDGCEAENKDGEPASRQTSVDSAIDAANAGADPSGFQSDEDEKEFQRKCDEENAWAEKRSKEAAATKQSRSGSRPEGMIGSRSKCKLTITEDLAVNLTYKDESWDGTIHPDGSIDMDEKIFGSATACFKNLTGGKNPGMCWYDLTFEKDGKREPIDSLRETPRGPVASRSSSDPTKKIERAKAKVAKLERQLEEAKAKLDALTGADKLSPEQTKLDGLDEEKSKEIAGFDKAHLQEFLARNDVEFKGKDTKGDLVAMVVEAKLAKRLAAG